MLEQIKPADIKDETMKLALIPAGHTAKLLTALDPLYALGSIPGGLPVKTERIKIANYEYIQNIYTKINKNPTFRTSGKGFILLDLLLKQVKYGGIASIESKDNGGIASIESKDKRPSDKTQKKMKEFTETTYYKRNKQIKISEFKNTFNNNYTEASKFVKTWMDEVLGQGSFAELLESDYLRDIGSTTEEHWELLIDCCHHLMHITKMRDSLSEYMDLEKPTPETQKLYKELFTGLLISRFDKLIDQYSSFEYQEKTKEIIGKRFEPQDEQNKRLLDFIEENYDLVLVRGQLLSLANSYNDSDMPFITHNGIALFGLKPEQMVIIKQADQAYAKGESFQPFVDAAPGSGKSFLMEVIYKVYGDPDTFNNTERDPVNPNAKVKLKTGATEGPANQHAGIIKVDGIPIGCVLRKSNMLGILPEFRVKEKIKVKVKKNQAKLYSSTDSKESTFIGDKLKKIRKIEHTKQIMAKLDFSKISDLSPEQVKLKIAEIKKKLLQRETQVQQEEKTLGVTEKRTRRKTIILDDINSGGLPYEIKKIINKAFPESEYDIISVSATPYLREVEMKEAELPEDKKAKKAEDRTGQPYKIKYKSITYKEPEIPAETPGSNLPGEVPSLPVTADPSAQENGSLPNLDRYKEQVSKEITQTDEYAKDEYAKLELPMVVTLNFEDDRLPNYFIAFLDAQSEIQIHRVDNTTEQEIFGTIQKLSQSKDTDIIQDEEIAKRIRDYVQNKLNHYPLEKIKELNLRREKFIGKLSKLGKDSKLQIKEIPKYEQENKDVSSFITKISENISNNGNIQLILKDLGPLEITTLINQNKFDDFMQRQKIDCIIYLDEKGDTKYYGKNAATGDASEYQALSAKPEDPENKKLLMIYSKKDFEGGDFKEFSQLPVGTLYLQTQSDLSYSEMEQAIGRARGGDPQQIIFETKSKSIEELIDRANKTQKQQELLDVVNIYRNRILDLMQLDILLRDANLDLQTGQRKTLEKYIIDQIRDTEFNNQKNCILELNEIVNKCPLLNGQQIEITTDEQKETLMKKHIQSFKMLYKELYAASNPSKTNTTQKKYGKKETQLGIKCEQAWNEYQTIKQKERYLFGVNKVLGAENGKVVHKKLQAEKAESVARILRHSQNITNRMSVSNQQDDYLQNIADIQYLFLAYRALNGLIKDGEISSKDKISGGKLVGELKTKMQNLLKEKSKNISNYTGIIDLTPVAAAGQLEMMFYQLLELNNYAKEINQPQIVDGSLGDSRETFDIQKLVADIRNNYIKSMSQNDPGRIAKISEELRNLEDSRTYVGSKEIQAAVASVTEYINKNPLSPDFVKEQRELIEERKRQEAAARAEAARQAEAERQRKQQEEAAREEAARAEAERQRKQQEEAARAEAARAEAARAEAEHKDLKTLQREENKEYLKHAADQIQKNLTYPQRIKKFGEKILDRKTEKGKKLCSTENGIKICNTEDRIFGKQLTTSLSDSKITPEIKFDKSKKDPQTKLISQPNECIIPFSRTIYKNPSEDKSRIGKTTEIDSDSQPKSPGTPESPKPGDIVYNIPLAEDDAIKNLKHPTAGFLVVLITDLLSNQKDCLKVSGLFKQDKQPYLQKIKFAIELFDLCEKHGITVKFNQEEVEEFKENLINSNANATATKISKSLEFLKELQDKISAQQAKKQQIKTKPKTRGMMPLTRSNRP